MLLLLLACLDVNECEDEELNDCEHTCRNLFGSYRCECPPGFELTAEGCLDRDECSGAYSVCQFECVNTEGSYECTCPDGYELHNGRLCRDVDECEVEDTCSETESCFNLYGGYECRFPDECDEGYSRAADTGPCVIEDYNEAINFAQPYSIMSRRIALHSGYSANSEVARLKFHRSQGHYYRFEIENGADNFWIQRKTQLREIVVVVRNVHKLTGPATHQLSIVIYDSQSYGRSGSNNFMNRVEMVFVVSPYSF